MKPESSPGDSRLDGSTSRPVFGCAGRLVRAWAAVERLHLVFWRGGAANVRRYGKPRPSGWLRRE